MGKTTEAGFLSVLEDVLALAHRNAIDFVIIGSLATHILLGTEFNPSEDIDIFTHREQAEPLLELLASDGYAVSRLDPSWIFKAAKPGVDVDIIFKAGPGITFDREMSLRKIDGEFRGVKLPLPSIEDLVVMQALNPAHEALSTFPYLVRALARAPIDWDYVAKRGEGWSERLLSLLFLARSSGVSVPGPMLTHMIQMHLSESRRL